MAGEIKNIDATTKYGNLLTGGKVQRKALITVAAWGDAAEGKEANREILGVRTEDSSIEFNPDVETTTDVCGVTYSDVNKTEPQQDFDPYYLLVGSKLGKYLADAALSNDITKYNGAFTLYIIAAFMDESDSETSHKYRTIKHEACSILPTSLGGDSYMSMPIEVHYSNNLTVGTVNELSDNFTFTADSAG